MKRRRRAAAVLGFVVAGAVITAAGWWPTTGAPRSGRTPSAASIAGASKTPARLHGGQAAAWQVLRPLTGPHLAAGSHPSVLPGPLLIADRSNNRLLVVNPKGEIIWTFPRPGDLRPGEAFQVPDDAFFSPTGTRISVTQEDDFAISLIDVAKRRIVYRYGTPGVAGAGPNHLWNPDDAMLLPGGWLLTADIKNCRLLVIRVGTHRPTRTIGTTTQACYHAPPDHWGSPNGAFPMRNGHFLVTEINGDWVDELTLSGRVLGSWHPPGFTYPSDTNEVRPGLYLSVNYANPGSVETFNRQGQLVWRYQPRPGDPQLADPSLALPLPNGDILLNDDGNNRVIVIDPRTNKIVWQYGHTGQPGLAPGYLNHPDGVDLTPPHSLLIRNRTTIGHP